MNWILCSGLAATIALGPGPAQDAQAPAAERAEEAFAAGRWDEAAEAFATAYAEDANPRYLYAQAQATRKAGDCRAAIELYAQFLEADPPAQAARLARDNMAECATEVTAQTQEPPPDPEPHPDTDSTQGAPLGDEPTPTPPRRWYADPAGGVLLGIAGVIVISGGVTYGLARREQTAANRAESEPQYVESIDRAGRLSRAGIALFAVGGAVLFASVIRYAVVGGRQRRQRRQTSARSFVIRF